MKTENLKNDFNFNKTTIVELSNNDMNNIVGGISSPKEIIKDILDAVGDLVDKYL